jgi:cytosine/adenosine deaminase-related metal-dependent hydrolase
MSTGSAPLRSLGLVNGRDAIGRRVDLCIVEGRIAALGASRYRAERVLDLHGCRVVPGLINAHDHLQLNHFPPLDYSRSYRNAREWVEDLIERKHIDPAIQAAAAVPLEERCLFGGLKNLLAGVTTVAHHDPLFECLTSSDFPTRVVQRYGWSHSLYLDGCERVKQAHADTPREHPWIVHAGEGIDDEARAEIWRLAEIGCLTANTLIVHGVAANDNDRRMIQREGAGLIWCPSSNLRLFGRTAQCTELIARERVALGTDSRLSGSSDLLEELRIAYRACGYQDATIEALVTYIPARLLKLSDRGALIEGALADIVVLPESASLHGMTRADLVLVLKDGEAQYGDESAFEAIAPDRWSSVRVDGKPKALRSELVRRMRASSLTERGIELPLSTWRAA